MLYTTQWLHTTSYWPNGPPRCVVLTQIAITVAGKGQVKSVSALKIITWRILMYLEKKDVCMFIPYIYE